MEILPIHNNEIKIETLTDDKKDEKKYKIFYSDYGYIKISEDDLSNEASAIYKFIQYKNNKNINYLLYGSIYKNNIKDNINIKLKYFHSKRSLIKFENINISSKLNILIEQLYQNEDPKSLPKVYTKNSQFRLYSCKSTIRELNTGLSFYENNIQNNEILLFFKQIPIVFSTTMKGKSIEISQGGKTAFKINIDDPHYVLCTSGFNGGRHYFEIKLLTDPMIRSVVVGLGIKKDEKNLFSHLMSKFYGFILSDMKKTEINFSGGDQENMQDYGEVFLINDNVGVLYDCRDDGVNITFYRNKKNLGIAFKNLPKDLVYYPTVEMGLCGSKIQISNDIDFPDDK